jgi:hypothetical protein
MVFLQVAVAQGKIPADMIARSFVEQPSVISRSGCRHGLTATLPSGLAPAHGLTLVKVEYRE